MDRFARQLHVTPSTSKLEVLTPNEKKRIVKVERERRRLIRYVQVRQQSSQNALKIRTKVKFEKQKELSLLKQELRKEISRRSYLKPILSPVQLNFTGKDETMFFGAINCSLHGYLNTDGFWLGAIRLISPPRRGSRKLTEEENRLIEERSREALQKIKKQREEHRVKFEKANELKRKAVREANFRSKPSPQ
ncbi:unnamed protein product [Enterobius vermicularis]|uniref:BZIP domain-containing protein n=1 Tax=Enterobius vermicularis TaxID=51028 RepID=A0A0N4VAT7_ENTVE|nr:unnamed protein product [Enterobius vermicularis]